jgi:predicted amidohydrolase
MFMPGKSKLKVATCQFSVSASARRNGTQVKRQMREAKRIGAQLVHFPECALSGYCGSELKNWKGYDWDALREEAEQIMILAKKLKVWVVLGSSHPLSGKHLPHNCLYVINPAGRIIDRYDKRFCTGGDLKGYSPGNHLTTFKVNGVKCGLAICYDVRFPELYREYKKQGVELMLDSFYNARSDGRNIHTTIMRASLQARAATNYFWFSVPNASTYYQSWPSVFIQPDGTIVQSLRQNRAGVMVNTVDTGKELYDASAPYRARAMKGILNSGQLVSDPRSRKRTAL